MNKTLSGVVAVGALLGILLFVNAIAKNLTGGMFVDLSEEKLFSLSPGSKGVVSKLEAPVTLKYFFSKTDSADFPGLKVFNDRILGLLKQYSRAGAGNVRLEVFDPRPDSEEADWAIKYGLRALDLPNGESVFFGLVGVSESGEEKSLPTFDLNNQEGIEYEVTKLIYSLSNAKKPKVVLLSSLDTQGTDIVAQAAAQGQQQRPRPWFFVQQLKEFADLSFLGPETTELPSDTDIVLLVHPKDLSEKILFAIDQHVLAGKSLIALVDPFCQMDRPQPTDGQPPSPDYDRSSDLNALLEKWGVKMLSGKILGDRQLATTVQTSRESRPQEFVFWLSLTEKNISNTDVISGALEQLTLPWSGSLELTPSDGVEIEPILTSSEENQLFDSARAADPQLDPSSLLKGFVPEGKETALAVRVKGKLKTNFPNGLSTDAASGVSTNRLLESTETSNVIVFADVDFISDRFSVNLRNDPFGGQVAIKMNDNLPLFFNAVDNMGGSSDLISIRSRGRVSRVFTKVGELEKIAAERWTREEDVFKAKLAEANQRLQNFQEQSQGAGEQVFSSALMSELESLRDKKAEAQSKLRNVRRNLREDVESLGSRLFLINTFIAPLVVALCFGFYLFFKGKRKQEL